MKVMSMLLTMPDLSWTVVCGNASNRFVWLYVFSHKGTVRWKDEGNGMTGNGTWRISGDTLTTRWYNSATVETWTVPINPANWTGKCTMKGLRYDLKAVARNFIEIDTDVIYTLTPESKAKFLESCNRATNTLMTAQIKFSGWLSDVSIAYARAFEEHNKILDDIAATQRLSDEMILGAVLAFVGGGVGGVAAGLAKKIMEDARGSEFVIDGIKDLAKFGVRGPGGAALRRNAFKKIAASPLVFRDSMNQRVMQEMAVASELIYNWRSAVASGDDTFNAGFDPDQEIASHLTVEGISLLNLPLLDGEALQKAYERGMLVRWIEKQGTTYIAEVTDVAALANRQKLQVYGRNLGLSNIDELLNQHWPMRPQPLFTPF
jgi:hypothetical protein